MMFYPKSVGVNEKGPIDSYLNAWFLDGRTVWKGLEDMALLEVGHSPGVPSATGLQVRSNQALSHRYSTLPACCHAHYHAGGGLSLFYCKPQCTFFYKLPCHGDSSLQ